MSRLTFNYPAGLILETHKDLREQAYASVGPFEHVGAQAVAAHQSSLAHEGRVPGDLVPAVHFIIQNAMACMEHPDIASRLPRHTYARTLDAITLIKGVTRMALDNNFFARYYHDVPELNAMLRADRNLVRDVRQYELLANLGYAAFTDVGLVGGGGHRFLQRNLPELDAAEVVAESTSLALMTAAIPREKAKQAYSGLGRPHLRPDNFRIIETADPAAPVRLDFSTAAHAQLHPLLEPRRGCPSGKVLTPEGERPTMLLNTWGRISHILLDGASTETPPTPQKRKPKRR